MYTLEVFVRRHKAWSIGIGAALMLFPLSVIVISYFVIQLNQRFVLTHPAGHQADIGIVLGAGVMARVKALYNVYVRGEPTVLGKPISLTAGH